MGVVLCSLPLCFYFLGFLVLFFFFIENQKLCVFSQSHTYRDKEEMKMDRRWYCQCPKTVRTVFAKKWLRLSPQRLPLRNSCSPHRHQEFPLLELKTGFAAMNAIVLKGVARLRNVEPVQKRLERQAPGPSLGVRLLCPFSLDTWVILNNILEAVFSNLWCGKDTVANFIGLLCRLFFFSSLRTILLKFKHEKLQGRHTVNSGSCPEKGNREEGVGVHTLWVKLAWRSAS